MVFQQKLTVLQNRNLKTTHVFSYIVMDWLWDVPIGSPVSPPDSTVWAGGRTAGGSREPLWELYFSDGLLYSLPLSPVHYKVKLPVATMNHVTMERALQNHSHPYFTTYVIYQVFLSQKWKTNYHTPKPPGSSVWQSLNRDPGWESSLAKHGWL